MCTERDKDPFVETFHRFAKNDDVSLIDFENDPRMMSILDRLHT